MTIETEHIVAIFIVALFIAFSFGWLMAKNQTLEETKTSYYVWDNEYRDGFNDVCEQSKNDEISMYSTERRHTLNIKYWYDPCAIPNDSIVTDVIFNLKGVKSEN